MADVGAHGGTRRRLRCVLPLKLALAAAITLMVCFPASVSSSTKASLIDVPVRFTVFDVNRSLVPCQAGGEKYSVAGRLVAPASGLGSAATIYMSGVIFSGLYEFHNDLVPGYDFAREMAKLGHTSVVIDRLGYGKTVPYPRDGRRVCFGALADGVHQIIAALRSARFTVVGAPHLHPKPFTRVAVAGYSLGGTIAEVEQASFADQSALALIGWADQGFSRFGSPPSYVFAHCSPGLPKSPGGRRGYFRTLPPWKVPHLITPAADPRIVATFRRHEELDPCGQNESGGVWLAGLARKALPQIRSPVLVLYGEYDALFTPQAWQPQWAHFTGTQDRTLIGIPDGQMLMLDRHVSMTRHMLSVWLANHGL